VGGWGGGEVRYEFITYRLKGGREGSGTVRCEFITYRLGGGGGGFKKTTQNLM
jgi:hypothetical protein